MTRVLCLSFLVALAGCDRATSGPDSAPTETDAEPIADPISTDDYELRLRGTGGEGISGFLVGIASVALKVDGAPVAIEPLASWLDLAATAEPQLIAKLPWREGDEVTYELELRFDEYGAREKNGAGFDFHSALLPLRWRAEKAGLEEHRRVVVELDLDGSVITTSTGEGWLMPKATIRY